MFFADLVNVLLEQLLMSSEVSSDNSVDFLQKEHAKTLKGLHGEITRLQQKCASEFQVYKERN